MNAPLNHPLSNEERANKWIVLALSGTASFMTTLDSSIVNIALPSIARAFNVELSGEIEWVVIGYLVVIASLLLTFGRVADLVGRKLIMVAGLGLFTLGSMACGAAPTLGALIAARCFQGLGAGAILSVNVAMITAAFPARQRARALGINMVLLALGVSAGPTLGGVLVHSLGWRWIFYVNVPIGAMVLAAAWFLLTERTRWIRQRLDVGGAALLAIALSSFTLGQSFGQEWGWISGKFLLCMVISTLALSGLAFLEGRSEHPLVNPQLLRNRVFVFANVSFLICMMALFAVGFLLPFYFEELRGYSTLHSGLLLTPLSLTLAVVAPISGVIADRFGARWLAPVGLATAGTGLLLLSRLSPETSTAYLIMSLVVTGIGQALFQSPNASVIMGSAPKSDQGIAAGTLATGRIVGQSFSVAVAGTIFTAMGGAAAGAALATGRTTLDSAERTHLQHTFTAGLSAAFIVCAVFAALGVLTSLARGKVTSADAPQPQK